MKHLKAFSSGLFVACQVLVFSAQGWSAYFDQVGAAPEAVWEAAQQVMAKYGIREQRPDAYELESNWIEDTMTVEKGIFSLVLPKQFARRYKFKVNLAKDDYGTRVAVNGVYQKRQLSALEARAASVWRKYKPSREEYLMERDFFMKVLQQLEKSGPHQGLS